VETEKIELPKQLMDSIRKIVEETKLFIDEKDFITQAVIKQVSKFK
jgi:hypothetical protein